MTIKAAREGFPEFCIAIDPRYQLEWFHNKIALKLEEAVKQVENGKDVRLMIFMPPRHGKSDEATQKFPSWALGEHPEWPVIVSSYSQELATDFGQGTRDIMDSPNYRAIFDTRLREDTQAKAKWMTPESGGYTAVGVGGAITGKGFKIGIVDDPFKNREEADSPVTREGVWKWWRSTFYTRQEGNTAIIVILTRWHDDDLAGRLLKEQDEAEKNGETDYDKWEILEFKAIAEEDEEYRKKGEALWPQKFNISKLNRTKIAIGSYEWSALYQQNPIDEENQEFKKDWLQYRTWKEVERMVTRKFATIDPAGSKNKKSDSTGVTRNYINTLNEWNLKSERYRINSKGMIDLIFQLHKEGFEQIGIEEGVFKDAIEPFLKIKMDEENIYPNVITLKHRGIMKETRIRGLIPRYENRKVFHIDNLCSDLEEEYLRFPKSAHDDCFDSVAYQNQLATGDEALEIEMILKNVSNDFNSQEDRVIIGVNCILPIYYTMMNKEGVFYYGKCEPVSDSYSPYAELEGYLRRWPRSVLIAEHLNDVGILDLIARYPGRVYSLFPREDRNSMEVIEWGEKDEQGRVLVDLNSFITVMVDQFKEGGRIKLNGTTEEWTPFAEHFGNIFKVKDETPLGIEFHWERKGPDYWVRSMLCALVGFDRWSGEPAIATELDWMKGLKQGRMFPIQGNDLRK